MNPTPQTRVHHQSEQVRLYIGDAVTVIRQLPPAPRFLFENLASEGIYSVLYFGDRSTKDSFEQQALPEAVAGGSVDFLAEQDGLGKP